MSYSGYPHGIPPMRPLEEITAQQPLDISLELRNAIDTGTFNPKKPLEKPAFLLEFHRAVIKPAIQGFRLELRDILTSGTAFFCAEEAYRKLREDGRLVVDEACTPEEEERTIAGLRAEAEENEQLIRDMMFQERETACNYTGLAIRSFPAELVMTLAPLCDDKRDLLAFTMDELGEFMNPITRNNIIKLGGLSKLKGMKKMQRRLILNHLEEMPDGFFEHFGGIEQFGTLSFEQIYEIVSHPDVVLRIFQSMGGDFQTFAALSTTKLHSLICKGIPVRY